MKLPDKGMNKGQIGGTKDKDNTRWKNGGQIGRTENNIKWMKDVVHKGRHDKAGRTELTKTKNKWSERQRFN
jgi:hypothetical protein